MSRAKPYRSKPTRQFESNLALAQQSRMFLVSEQGPTKLTLEDQKQKKYQILIGSEISCSCGGGVNEHCVHTIFSLLKIFKISEDDPLIWQLGYLDAEI